MIEPSDTTNACPRCGRSKAPDTIGHRHTGAQCFWCGFSTDRDEAEIAGSGEAEGKAMSEKSETTDILDRLRPWAVHDGETYGPNEKLVADAIAEIERLRALVAHYADQCGVAADELRRVHGV